jgi:uncharacterized alpha-E superfamily protein
MLLSSSAETVFWFGRHLERAGALSRAFLTYEELGLDMPKSLTPHGGRLLSSLGLSWVTSPTSLSTLRASWVLDVKNPSSVLGALRAARENLRIVRSFVPVHAWEALNTLYLVLESADQNLPELLGALERVEAVCHQLGGYCDASMTRDDAYVVLDVGRHLERADMMLRLVTLTSELVIPDDPRPFDDVRWSALLKSVDAFEMYRRCHRGRLELGRVLDFLLFSPSFPRSLLYCLNRIELDLAALPENSAVSSALLRCRLNVELSDDRPARIKLQQASATLASLAELNSTLSEVYFAPHSSREPSALDPRSSSNETATNEDVHQDAN